MRLLPESQTDLDAFVYLAMDETADSLRGKGPRKCMGHRSVMVVSVAVVRAEGYWISW